MDTVKLILTDLDGTLFHDDKSISPLTKQTILDAQKKGVLFGISTSRALVNAVRYLDGITPDIAITNGGGLVLFNNEKIYSCEFSVQDTRRLIVSCFRIFGDDIIISIDNEKSLYSNADEDEFGDRYWTYTDFKNFDESAMKICIQTQDGQKVQELADSFGKDKIDLLPFSDIPWFKLSRKDATKDNAIKALGSKLNIPLEQIVSFGDDFNDIGMLQVCGIGVAMANAIPEVKHAADQTCKSNNEDGVAHWIIQNIL